MISFMPSTWSQWFTVRFTRWLNQRIQPTRTIRLDRKNIFIFPTREGFLFGIVMITIFLGGVNYGNSLVLGLSYFLVGIFIIAIVHTFRNLSGVVVEASRVESCFAGEAASFTVNISRGGARVHENICLKWEQSFRRVCDVVAEREANVVMLLPTTSRGWYVPGRLKIYTTFPLGIISAWSWLDLNVRCLVYPHPLNNTVYQAGSQVAESGKSGRELGLDDFEGLRLYRTGDSLKHVHWKTFARTGEMHSKTFVAAVQAIQWLDWSDFQNQDVEHRLSCLCYWVLRLSELNRPYGLRMPGDTISPSTGVSHKRRCLALLATYGC